MLNGFGWISYEFLKFWNACCIVLWLGLFDCDLSGASPVTTVAPKAELPNVKKRPKKTRLGIRTEAGQDNGKVLLTHSACFARVFVLFSAYFSLLVIG